VEPHGHDEVGQHRGLPHGLEEDPVGGEPQVDHEEDGRRVGQEGELQPQEGEKEEKGPQAQGPKAPPPPGEEGPEEAQGQSQPQGPGKPTPMEPHQGKGGEHEELPDGHQDHPGHGEDQDHGQGQEAVDHPVLQGIQEEEAEDGSVHGLAEGADQLPVSFFYPNNDDIICRKAIVVCGRHVENPCCPN
jgi:hypothetical protein